MLNDDLINHLFNWFGLSWETRLKLWSNQIIIPLIVLSWYLEGMLWKQGFLQRILHIKAVIHLLGVEELH